MLTNYRPTFTVTPIHHLHSIKAADLQHIDLSTRNSNTYNSCKKSKQSLKPIYFHLFALKTDNLLFGHLDIPTIHNTAVD